MKKALFLLVVASLSVGVFAQKTKPKPAPPKTKVKCPVMTTNNVDIASATKAKMFADYKGRRYFFCCGGCPEAFKANPAKFAKGESIPTPKKPRAKGKSKIA